MPKMTSMQHAVFVAPGQLEWRETHKPELQSSLDAIVRPIVVGRCDLDTMYVTGRMPLASGEPIGHEIIAEVIDIGSAVAAVHVGQRVIVSAQISCGQCTQCQRGFTARCVAVPFGASFGMGRAGNYGGGLSDYLRVPFADAMLVPIPATANPVNMIGLADMATDAWRAVGPALSERPNGCVLIIGGATPVIGIYAAGIAKSLDASCVDYVDADTYRRKAAASYGARTFEHIDACENAYDIIVDASGSASQLLAALQRIAPEAFVISVSPALVGPAFPMLELYMKGVTYKVGRPNCRAGHSGALHAWSANGFAPEKIQPLVRPFNDACETWIDPSLFVAVTRAPVQSP
jgi:threonine dehydrogenase-like Zn-dependent dehydrogenase